MGNYIGLDVSQQQTAICIVNEAGERIKEGKANTNPGAIAAWITEWAHPKSIVHVGLEAGAMAAWLYAGLKKLDLPVVCLETFQAHQFLKSHRNKTDKNDARGLAQLVRMGPDYFKTVIIRSEEHQAIRLLLNAREHLISQKIGLENNITGCLKPFGILVRRGHVSAKSFRSRIMPVLTELEARNIAVRHYLLPLVDAYDSVYQQLKDLTQQAHQLAKESPICRRLMTAPGVGPIVALSYMTAVDQPERFRNGEDVGAYFGLTAKQYQSGETDIRGSISKRGNHMTRKHLVQAATSLLVGRKWSVIKAWGMKIGKRSGFSKARVAVARKLSIILHRMWRNEEDFRWTSVEEKALAA